VATLGMDEVADLFVGTEDEDAYESFMSEAQRALAVDGTDTPTPATVSCKTCAGTGEYPPTNGVTCPWCDGEGEVPAGDTSTANPETDE
jgi:DnaJ-class molecular chaperone